MEAVETKDVVTFKDFKEKVLKNKVNEYMKVYNDANTDIYESLNIFGKK